MGKVMILGLLAVTFVAAGTSADVINPAVNFNGTGDSGTASLSVVGSGSMTASGTVYVKILLWWVPLNVNFNTTGIPLTANPEPTNWTSDPTGTGQVGFDAGNPPLGNGTVNALDVDIKNGAAWNLALDRITLTDPGNAFYKFFLDMTGAINMFRFDMTGAPTGTFNSGSPPTVTYDVSPFGVLTTGYTTTMTGSLSLGFTFLSNWYSVDVPLGTVFTSGATLPLPETADGTMTLNESSGMYPHDVNVGIEASVGPVSLPFRISDSFTINKAMSGSNPYYNLTGNYSFSGLMQIENAHFSVSDTVQDAIPDPYPAKLTLNVVEPGWGEVQVDPPPPYPDNSYNRGTVVTLTAVPATGCAFDSWSGAASGTTNPIQITMDGDKNVTANFAQLRFTLTLASDPPGNGTVDAVPPPEGDGRYALGTVVTLTATPAEGYLFGSWSGDASGPDNPTQVTMDGNKSVTADFVRAFTLTLSVSHNNWGSVNVEPNLPAYPEGATVTLTAEPISGKSFKEWTIYDPNYPGDANLAEADSNSSITVVMNTNRQIDADFKCGSGLDSMLPLLSLVLLAMFYVRRRC
jgi:hypothetical protein